MKMHREAVLIISEYVSSALAPDSLTGRLIGDGIFCLTAVITTLYAE